MFGNSNFGGQGFGNSGGFGNAKNSFGNPFTSTFAETQKQPEFDASGDQKSSSKNEGQGFGNAKNNFGSSFTSTFAETQKTSEFGASGDQKSRFGESNEGNTFGDTFNSSFVGSQNTSPHDPFGNQKSSFVENDSESTFADTLNSPPAAGQKPLEFGASESQKSSSGEKHTGNTFGNTFNSPPVAAENQKLSFGEHRPSNVLANTLIPPPSATQKPFGFGSSVGQKANFVKQNPGSSLADTFNSPPAATQKPSEYSAFGNQKSNFGKQNPGSSLADTFNSPPATDPKPSEYSAFGNQKSNFGENRPLGGNQGSSFGSANNSKQVGGNDGGSGLGKSNENFGFGSKSEGTNFGGNSGFKSDETFGHGSGFGGTNGNSGFGDKNGDCGFGESNQGGRAEPRGPMKCHNCRGKGHRSKECPEPPRGCFNCGQQGHISQDCPEPPKSRENGGDENKPRATFIPEEEEMESVFNLQKIQEGKMFQNFFDAEVTVSSGTERIDVKPIRSFEEANLPELMLRNVKHAGYSKTTPIQQYSIPLISRGFDMLACAQTGCGKTAAFLLPIMNKLIQEKDLNTTGECGCFPRCIILAPSRELANQIYNEGRKFAYQTMVEIKAVYGGVVVGHSRSQIESGASIIVGTVGRIKQFIDKNVISLEKLRYLVLDEADRMIDNMGFGDDITYITQARGMPNKENRQTLMFSATFPDSIQMACREYMRPQYAMIVIDKIGTANKCVTQEFIMCDKFEKREKLLELLGVDMDTYSTEIDNDVFTKKTIVFVSRRNFADSLAVTLSASGIPTITIHGAREQSQRDQALRMFRSGSHPILIATAVAERGLDIKGVDHVINFDMPESIDNYIHRIGRTGRVGNAGRATSFVSSADSNLFGDIERMLNEAGQIVPSFMENSGGHGDGVVAETADEDW